MNLQASCKRQLVNYKLWNILSIYFLTQILLFSALPENRQTENQVWLSLRFMPPKNGR